MFESLQDWRSTFANSSSENNFIDLIMRNAFDNVRLHSIINFIQLFDNIQS